MKAILGICLCACLLPFLASPVQAATFDLIYADRLEVTTYPGNTGFMLAGTDIALVVNKGATNIDAAEFFGATFTATSSNPAVDATLFINNPGPVITPIHPNEALGSVSAYNGVLTSKLLPTETLHNTAPMQVLAMQVNYPAGFSGQATINAAMTMGGEVVHYAIVVNCVLGSAFDLAFPSAARTSSRAVPTPTQLTTWGRIKSQYH